MAAATPFRRVETGHDRDGRAVIVSDGTPPRTVESPGGTAVSELLWLDGPARTPDDGRDRGSDEEGYPTEAPPGGMSFRIIRFPPGTFRAMHSTDTLDYVVVVDGEIALGLDDGEHVLRQGDVVIQRGNRHSWRVVGDRPALFGILMMRPDPRVSAVQVDMQPPSTLAGDPGDRVRRLVAATDAQGKSYALSDGVPQLVFEPSGPGGVSIVDLWQTGGPLRSCEQGGDAARWELDPIGAGISCRTSELPAGLDPGDRGWHATPTIDFDLVLSGQVELALPGGITTVVGPGETVLQRGTNHRWRPVGRDPVRWFAIMIGCPGSNTAH